MKGREKMRRKGKQSKRKGRKKAKNYANFWKEGKNMIFDFGANMYPCNCNCMNH